MFNALAKHCLMAWPPCVFQVSPKMCSFQFEKWLIIQIRKDNQCGNYPELVHLHSSETLWRRSNILSFNNGSGRRSTLSSPYSIWLIISYNSDSSESHKRQIKSKLNPTVTVVTSPQCTHHALNLYSYTTQKDKLITRVRIPWIVL